jgi:hypothetical protein
MIGNGEQASSESRNSPAVKPSLGPWTTAARVCGVEVDVCWFETLGIRRPEVQLLVMF